MKRIRIHVDGMTYYSKPAEDHEVNKIRDFLVAKNGKINHLLITTEFGDDVFLNGDAVKRAIIVFETMNDESDESD